MMHRAGGVCADFVNGATDAALTNNSIRRELAHLKLGSLRLVLGLRLLVANGRVLISRQDFAAFLLSAVGRADLDELRLRDNLLGDVCPDLRLIAAWISASILPAEVGKQEFVVACPLGAIDTTPGDGHEMRITLIERCILEQEQHILL